MVLDIFGKCPQAKTISFLLSCPFDEYTKKQIAIGSEISRTTLDTFINRFLELKILIKKENNKYELNQKSEIVHLINQLEEKLVKIEIKKQMGIFEEKSHIKENKFSVKEINEMLDDIPDYIPLNDQDTKDLVLEERKELERLKNIEKEFELMVIDLKEEHNNSENKLMTFEKLLKRPKTIRH
ncbi:MAG: hypothetical protein FWH54_02090 [Methanobrevibacter sp.]|nr:hypothetical protein [Methanobrevibacter sp.]